MFPELAAAPWLARLFPDFDKFQPVSPRIFRVKPPLARQIIVICDGHAAFGQRFAKLVQIENRKRRVSLLGWPEIPFDADMELVRAALEPATAACPQHGRLLDFLHAENCAVKFPGHCFTSFGRCDLDVINVRDLQAHGGQDITARSLLWAASGGTLTRRKCALTSAAALAGCGAHGAGAELLQ